MKRVIPLMPAVAALLLLVPCSSCSGKKSPPPPVVVHAPDYKPIGEGIKVHSYALIGVAVIIVVGMMAGSGKE